MKVRFWKKGGPRFSEAGWEGVSDDPPIWTDTVEAAWSVRGYDRIRLATAVIGTAVSALLATQFWFRPRANYLPAAVIATLLLGIWAARQLKHRTPTLTLKLILTPDRLWITSGLPSIPAAELRRDQAGWLVALENGTDWNSRGLLLYDEAGNGVAQFTGRMASVRVERSGSAGAHDVVRIPRKVTVAALIGSWWPHPARRMIRAGTMSVRFPWRDPDLADYVAWQHRQGRLWALLLGAFGFFCLIAAVVPDAHTPVTEHVLVGVAGAALMAYSSRLAAWKPDYT